MRRGRIEKADVAILIAVSVFFALLYMFSQFVQPAELKALVLSWGIYGPIAIIGMQVAFSVLAPLPNSIPVIVSGSLYGTVEGALYASIGTVIGAGICYALAIRFGRGFVKKMISRKHLETMDVFFRRHGFESIVIARLVPVMSFDAVSYGAGLAKMDFWKFIAATVVGMIPGTVIYAFIGDSLSFQWLVFAMAVIVVASALVLPFARQIAEGISGLNQRGGKRQKRRVAGRR